MISFVIPYFLTFLGLVIDGAHHFLAMAIILTVIGVIWTGIACMTRDYSNKGIAIAEGVHAVIWLMFKVFPAFGAKLLGGFIGLVIAALIILLFVVFVMGGGDEEKKTSGGGGTPSMPNIIYDDNNNRWQLSHRNGGGESVYHNDAGQEVHIYHQNVSGTNANTSAGNFHW